MAYELKNVVPWGRNLYEYKKMFHLTDSDLNKKIISFGDGPASFNFEMWKRDKSVISVDPIYQFTTEQIKRRIAETKDIVVEQTLNNRDNFVWKHFNDVPGLVQTRMKAMLLFMEDFDNGKHEGRYLAHSLPEPLHFDDQIFDIGLSSHFLMLYPQLGLPFHIQSITEMLRICNEIRIFPLLNLDAQKSDVLDDVLLYFQKKYRTSILEVDYEIQKGGNQMLSIINK